MANVVVVILQDPDLAAPLLKAWIKAGATGATVVSSSGISRELGALRDDVPLLPSLKDFEAGTEDELSRIVFSVVGDEDTLEKVITSSTAVVGDFSVPGVGLLFVLPVSRVIGMREG